MTRYAEVLAGLFASRRAGIVLGLDRVAAVLARLDHPERRLGAVVHVGGTNGKGSTAAMIAAIAAAAGRRVAVYASPHLSTLRERIVASGRMIAEAEVVEAAVAVDAAGGGALTFFERLTAMALWWIAAARPEVTVLEVGLGGRLDATNVVDADVAVVTGVARDHEAILGDTIAAIAAEKAGIFKPGRRAVIGASGDPAATLVLLAGAAACARVTVVDPARPTPPVALRGAHQRRNAACALAAIDHLEALGALEAPTWIREAGLRDVRHAGRMESRGPPRRARAPIVLDGAHNPDGAAALAAEIGAMAAPRVLVIAVSADKDLGAMLAPLVGGFDAVVATRYAQPRALPPTRLAETARDVGGRCVEEAPDLAAALARAAELAGAGTIVVAGSLMLVGEARTLLLGAPTDPFVVTDPAP